MKPSSSTERLTCLRDAPSVRRVASSRTRCATVIESVLKMTNEPTISEIAANASRKYLMIASPSFVSLESAAPCSAPVRTTAELSSSGLTWSATALVLDAALGGDEDRVDLSLLVQHGLRRRHVEDGEGRSADRVDRAESRDADDVELPRRPLRRGTDLVADRVVLLRRRGGVDHDLVRAVRPRAGGERQRVEALLVGVESPAEVGRLAGAELLPVPTDQLREVGRPAHVVDRAGCGRHTRKRAHLLNKGLRNGRLSARRVLHDLLAGDHGARTLVRVLVEPVECLCDGVRQDVGAADHRHPEHDRQCGERGAQLAAPQPLDRGGDHRFLSPSIVSSTWCSLRPWTSSTIDPSARNRMRSAIAAALASWVTISVV